MSKKIGFFLLISIIFIASFALLIKGKKSKPSASHSMIVIKTSLFQQQVQKICGMLNNAEILYSKSKFKQAHALSETAYWDVYDNILEIKYRSYGTPAEIFAVENQFHNYSSMLKAPLSIEKQKRITLARVSICKTIKKQADILDKNE